MENNFSILLQDDFLDMLMDTQREVERLGLKCVSNLFILKSLIYAKESNIKDVLNYAGVSWKKIETSMEKQVRKYIQNEKNTKYASFGKEDEYGEFAVYCDTKSVETLENAVNYLLDSYEVGEVEFILAMFDNYDIYIESFFRGINIDTRLIEGYYRSLEATLRTTNSDYEEDDDYDYDYDEEDYDEDDEDEDFYDEIEELDEEEYLAMIEELEYDNEKVVYKNRKVKAMMICLFYEDEDQEEDEK